MLEALRFVKGAVPSRDTIAELTHFYIMEGRITSCNGNITLSTPIPTDINMCPKAIPFIKAIEKCEEATQMGLTSAGRLSIKSGKFRAYIDCLDEPTPLLSTPPEGTLITLPPEVDLLEVAKIMYPFIGEDASRPFCRGLWISGTTATVTNNIVLIQYWLRVNTNISVNIPKPTIKELIRINQPVRKIQVSETSITFHYEGDKWMKSQLYSNEWPDVCRLFPDSTNQQPFDPEIIEALDTIKDFVDPTLANQVIFGEGKIKTCDDDGIGAVYEIPSVVDKGRFNLVMLRPVCDIIETIDWSHYPSPVMFMGKGNNLRGVIVGVRE